MGRFTGAARHRFVAFIRQVERVGMLVERRGGGPPQRGLTAQLADTVGTQGARAAGQAGGRGLEQFKFLEREVGKVLQLGRS